MLQLAGLEMPGYNQFLMNLKEQLPIIGVGAVCDKDGNWYANDALPDDYKKLMTDYNILEYNNQFEKKDVIESLFTLKLLKRTRTQQMRWMVTLAVTVNGVNSNLWLFFVWVFSVSPLSSVFENVLK